MDQTRTNTDQTRTNTDQTQTDTAQTRQNLRNIRIPIRIPSRQTRLWGPSPASPLNRNRTHLGKVTTRLPRSRRQHRAAYPSTLGQTFETLIGHLHQKLRLHSEVR